jgi:hypothetical protein
MSKYEPELRKLINPFFDAICYRAQNRQHELKANERQMIGFRSKPQKELRGISSVVVFVCPVKGSTGFRITCCDRLPAIVTSLCITCCGASLNDSKRSFVPRRYLLKTRKQVAYAAGSGQSQLV